MCASPDAVANYRLPPNGINNRIVSEPTVVPNACFHAMYDRTMVYSGVFSNIKILNINVHIPSNYGSKSNFYFLARHSKNHIISDFYIIRDIYS